MALQYVTLSHFDLTIFFFLFVCPSFAIARCLILRICRIQLSRIEIRGINTRMRECFQATRMAERMSQQRATIHECSGKQQHFEHNKQKKSSSYSDYIFNGPINAHK